MRSLFLTFLTVFMLSSCDMPPGHGGGNGGGNQHGVVGNWQWTDTKGGLYYQEHTPLTTGYNAVLSLSSDNTFKFEQTGVNNDNHQFDQGTYKIDMYEIKETLELSTQLMRAGFHSLAFPYDKNYIEISSDGKTLTLRGIGADMYTYTFSRN